METRANYILIGLFTLAVIAAAFGFVYWFARFGDGEERRGVDIVFPGAVTGLSQGSQVLFNGIRVGDVANLMIDPTNPRQVIGHVRVAADTPIRTDTEAQLEYQGITGVGYVALSGGSSDAELLLRDSEDDIPVIVAERSAFEDIVEGARDILGQADGVLRRFDRMLQNNEEAVTNTVSNAETLTANLAAGSEDLGRLMSSAGDFAEAFSNLSTNLETTIATLNELAQAIEPESVSRTLSNIEDFSGSLAESSQEVGELMANARRATSQVNEILDGARGLPETFTRVAGAAEELIRDLDGIAMAVDTRRIDRTLGNVERFSESILANTDEIDRVVADAAELSGKLNSMADRVDTVIARVDGYLEGDGQGFIEEATRAAQSFRRLSEQLEGRVDGVLDDVSQFTGRGLQDFESFVSDGRRTLNSLDRVINNLERNPRQFILGGERVPEYRGR